MGATENASNHGSQAQQEVDFLMNMTGVISARRSGRNLLIEVEPGQKKYGEICLMIGGIMKDIYYRQVPATGKPIEAHFLIKCGDTYFQSKSPEAYTDLVEINEEAYNARSAHAEQEPDVYTGASLTSRTNKLLLGLINRSSPRN